MAKTNGGAIGSPHREPAWKPTTATHAARPRRPIDTVPDVTGNPEVAALSASLTLLCEHNGVRIKQRTRLGHRPIWADRAGWNDDVAFWTVGVHHMSNWPEYAAGSEPNFDQGTEVSGIVPVSGDAIPSLGLVMRWATGQHWAMFIRAQGLFRLWLLDTGLPTGDNESRMIFQSNSSWWRAVAMVPADVHLTLLDSLDMFPAEPLDNGLSTR